MGISKENILVLAPHLEYPLRNGADILIDRRWAAYSKYVNSVDILGSGMIISYRNGRQFSVQYFTNRRRSKIIAAFFTLAKRTHYLVEKFITPDFKNLASIYINKPHYDVIVSSYIGTASVIEKIDLKNCRYFIETHNDELQWFFNIRLFSRNPIVKLIAKISENWLNSYISKIKNKFIFICVSIADSRAYEARFPSLKACVAPIGCDPIGKTSGKLKAINLSRPIKLIFVGSLNVKMNFDALLNFSLKFYPAIQRSFSTSQSVKVRVVGSRPTKKVRQLCNQMNWELYADISDDQLTIQYDWADFSILPFSYSSGGKLKLLKSLSHAAPFLSTTVAAEDFHEVSPICLISDAPSDWANHILKIHKYGITPHQRSELLAFASRFSWSELAKDLHVIMKKSFVS